MLFAAKHVCSPPPRDKTAKAIWTGLRNGTFTVLSSDHCTFNVDDDVTGKKTCISEEFPVGRFRHIFKGLPGVEMRLPMAFAATVRLDRLPLTKLVEVTSTNAAKLYGLYPKNRAMMPGLLDADLVIRYPNEGSPKRPAALDNLTISNSMLHHDIDYTPFEGRRVTNWPRYTVLRGKVVWDRDREGIIGCKGYGRFVEREASTLNDIWQRVKEAGPFDEEFL
ncbi:hypothetical protein Sste5346_002128 [Sporothrix stenoceras]|uniref:Dihydropyrimidinase n=1 Tax=Sporothrix stenoceras TaxID=5173 RepID=A0ABR3ZLV0_9PEZI